MTSPLSTSPLDAVSIALTYAPLGVADAAKHELSQLMGRTLVIRLTELQAERNELLTYARDAFWALEAIIKHEPGQPLTPKALANQFMMQHAKTSVKVLQ